MSHKCDKNGIQSDMDEHSLFLKVCPPLDDQLQNKGAIDEPEKCIIQTTVNEH